MPHRTLANLHVVCKPSLEKANPASQTADMADLHVRLNSSAWRRDEVDDTSWLARRFSFPFAYTVWPSGWCFGASSSKKKSGVCDPSGPFGIEKQLAFSPSSFFFFCWQRNITVCQPRMRSSDSSPNRREDIVNYVASRRIYKPPNLQTIQSPSTTHTWHLVCVRARGVGIWSANQVSVRENRLSFSLVAVWLECGRSIREPQVFFDGGCGRPPDRLQVAGLHGRTHFKIRVHSRKAVVCVCVRSATRIHSAKQRSAPKHQTPSVILLFDTSTAPPPPPPP